MWFSNTLNEGIVTMTLPYKHRENAFLLLFEAKAGQIFRETRAKFWIILQTNIFRCISDQNT